MGRYDKPFQTLAVNCSLRPYHPGAFTSEQAAEAARDAAFARFAREAAKERTWSSEVARLALINELNKYRLRERDTVKSDFLALYASPRAPPAATPSALAASAAKLLPCEALWCQLAPPLRETRTL